MANARRPPVLLLTFANDRVEGARYLRNLPAELRGIRHRLEPAVEAGLCELVVRTSTTVAELTDVLQDRRYRDRIAIFHYGGHAGGFGLLLESVEGHRDTAHARGLARLLGALPELRLAFLNGCATEPQVEDLLAAGVPAVIATAESIADAVATELAVRFYAAIGGGAPLAPAFEEAVAAVRTARGNDLRDVHRSRDTPSDRWPWRLHVRKGADLARDWNLASASGDPLFGLPQPPQRDLPESPYRHLQWFRAEDAEIFFGRGREIRAFHDLVTSASSAPILLFYGQSGVGKSSLLAAGVIPRLQATHEVRYARRERDGGVTETLRHTLGAAEDISIAHAWLAVEDTAGRPLVVVLDQVEEVYTRPGRTDELDAFVRAIEALFLAPGDRPRGRLVLSFRKEWLAEVESAMRDRALPRSKFYLERLDRQGIIDIVEGPTRSERLRTHFRLTVEPGLAEIIADDLLEDPNAAVAPTLAILLTKMWVQATGRGADSPSFDRPSYQGLRRRGLLLDDFVREQLEALREWNEGAVESGLALDVLYFHTTPVSTAEQRTRQEIDAAYAHQRSTIAALLDRCEELYLLTRFTAVGDHGEAVLHSRLSHDTLAPIIRHRFDESDRPGQRARRILDSRVAEWRNAPGIPLSQADLATVEAGQGGIRAWSETEKRIIAASRARRVRASWIRRGLVAAAIAAVGLILNQTRIARERAAESESRALAAAALDQPEVELGLLVAIEAVRSAETAEARHALLSGLNRPNPRLRRAVHAGPGVEAVAVSPDGSLVAVGTDTIIQIRDARTGAELHEPLIGHSNTLMHVRFSPDGSVLASNGFEENAFLWDARTWQPIGEPLRHERPVVDIAFSPDGDMVATAGFDGVVRFWDVTTGVQSLDSLQIDVAAVGSVVFHPGASILGAVSGYTARLWNLDTRQPITDTLTLNDGQVFAAAISPDGTVFAYGGGTLARSGSIGLVDIATGELLGRLTGHRSEVQALAFRSDGLLASGSNDGTVRLWDVPTMTSWDGPLAAYTGGIAFAGGVQDVAFSPDASLLVSGGTDGFIRLWEMLPWQSVADSLPMRGAATVAFDTVSGMLFAGGLGFAGRWNASTGDSTGEWIVDSSTPYALAISPDGTRIATGGSGGTIMLRDAASGEAIGELQGHTSNVYGLAFSPDGRLLASASWDETLRLWDVGTMEPVGEPLEGHVDDVVTVAFSPDGTTLASGAEDAIVRFWDVPSGQPIGGIVGHSDAVRSLAFSPDGALIATASDDGLAVLWRMLPRQPTDELPSGEYVPVEPHGDVLSGHRYGVTSVAFSPDGSLLATGSNDGTVRLWDVASEQPIGEPFDAYRGAVNAVAFSPDGTVVAAGSDGGLHVWPATLDSWIGRACLIAGRNMPTDLWTRLMPERPYACTCSEHPPGEGSEATVCSG